MIIEGEVVPPRTIELGGKAYAMPKGCRFTFALPPTEKARGWRQQGEPLFDMLRNTCKAAFEVGVPARFAQSRADASELRPGVMPQQETIPTTSSGYYIMWWTDPPPFGNTVTWVTAGINWFWQGTLHCAEYLGGSFNDWGYPGTNWQKLGEWDVGSDITCNDVGYKGSSLWTNYTFPPCTPLNPMYLTYDFIEAWGANDGYLYGRGTTYTSGGACRFLLSPHADLVRTMN
jgi:hypothetical protein